VRLIASLALAAVLGAVTTRCWPARGEPNDRPRSAPEAGVSDGQHASWPDPGALAANEPAATPDRKGEEFTFEIEEFEKRPYSFKGFGELEGVIFSARREAAFHRLSYYRGSPGDPFGEATAHAQIEATYERGVFRAFARGNGYARSTGDGSDNDGRLYEGYVTLRPNENLLFDAGKKALRWGKGYAWSPIAFADRPKNPDDPEIDLEGYTIASMDLIVSFGGALKTLSFTPVILPVYENVNGDFAETRGVNHAGRLYILLWDTDIDFVYLVGPSRSSRFGVDLSRNITSNFEIHAEIAHFPDFAKRSVDEAGDVREQRYYARAGLAGVRYLTELETTIILEYYYNGTGMSVEEMTNYYDLIWRANTDLGKTLDEEPLKRTVEIGRGGYGRINPMRNYAFLRVSQKEPFDILYFTPAISTIYNIDDESYSITAELLYERITNLEMRLRLGYLHGSADTELGEKPYDRRLDLRVRYYL
jgi:hypothetical protein